MGPGALLPVAATVAASAASAGAIAAGTATFLGLSATAWTAVGIGVSIAGTLATTLLQEQPPKPKMAEGNLSTKQAIPARVRGYGRIRIGGDLLYDDSTNDGDLNRLLHHVSHLVAAFEERWLADERVQLDGSGNVLSDPWYREGSGLGDESFSTVVVAEYRGTADQVVDTIPDPPWTTDHRGAGLCLSRVKYSDLGAEDQMLVFPSGPQNYSVVLRAAMIYDPRAAGQSPFQVFGNEATYEWSDNGALVVLDFLTRVQVAADGTRVPWGFGIKEQWIDFDSFAAAADASDDEIERKDMLFPPEKRWRSWGKYALTEDRKAVLGDLLDACCGRLLQGPDGRIGLDVGKPDPAAAVTITDLMILEYDLSAGKSAITRVNEVRVTYISEDWNYNETEAGIQSDLDAIDRNGLESIKQSLRFVPAESQAQRVAKFLLRKGSPSWQGRIRGKLALLNAWGERWVRLTLAELEIDQVFEVGGIRLLRDDTSLTVEMEITSYDGWFDWNPATDEQDPAEPPPDTDEDGSGVPMPENVQATIEHRNVNGQGTVAIGVISCDPAPRTVYKAWARVRPATIPSSPPEVSPWELIAAPQDTWQVKTGPLADGTEYEAQMSFTGPRGSRSKWVPLPPPDDTGPVEFTAVADPVAPAQPTGLTAQANTPGTGQVTVSATQPNDPRAASLRLYRNSSNTFVGATILSGMPLYVGPGQSRSVVETPGAGDWYYFATSSNWSNVASAAAGGVLAEVSPAAPVILTAPATIGQTNPTVSGTGPAGSTIKVFANAVLNVTTTADGSGNWSVALIALGSGAQAITATATVGGNESSASGSVTLTVVWYDPDASGHADFKGGNYRLNGAGSTLAGIFDTITTSATFVTNADGSLHAIAANAAPLSDLGLELWENRTNRCTNRNAKPTDLTGVTASGAGTAGGVTLVNDSAAMAGGILAAVLASTDINGSVFKLDNSTGGSDAFATISGTVATVGACRGSIVYRGSAGRIEIGGATAVSFGASTPYARVGGSRTAAATSEQMRIAAPAGAVIYFILNQLENGAFDTAPIVVNAATAARNSPLITRTAGADFSATEGFFGARAKVVSGVTNSGIVVGSLQTTLNDANVIQFTTATAMRGLTQVAAAATGLASQSLTATNMTTGVYGYKANDFGFSANGLTTVTDVSGALPSGTPAKITISLNTSPPLNGVIEQAKWGTTKPSTAALQAKSGWTTTT